MATSYDIERTSGGMDIELADLCIGAIKARCTGTWDRPCLKAVGPMSTDLRDDILAIIAYYESEDES